MATIGELIINLNASTASFVTELERVKNLSFDTAKQVQRSFSLIGTAALGMLSVASAAFVEGVKKTVEWEVHLLHLSQSSGMTVESLSGLSLAAKMMGIEIDQVGLAMERLDKQLIASQLGNKKAQQNMSLLGIDPAAIKTSDQALMLLADHFSKMPDGILKTGEAMLAFGKAGAQMIPILNLGAKGVQDFMDQAKAMGLVITKDQAEEAERFEQNMTRMKESLHGLWVEITNATIPALNALSAQFRDTSKQEGFWHATGRLTAAVMEGWTGLSKYALEGQLVIAGQEKMRTTVTDLTAKVQEHAKAFDALKKSAEAIITSLKTQIATFGMSAQKVQEYKIATDAAKLGQQAWAAAEIDLYRELQKKLDLMQQFAALDTSKRDEEKKNFLADKLKADQDDLAAMQAQLEVMLKMDTTQFAPTSTIGAFQATVAFTDAINQETAAVEHSIAVFGMSADEITRFDLAQLDGSVGAQKMIDKLIAEQDQLRAMQTHAAAMTNAWKEFGQVADRSLNDLIFSGKKFTQVLADITKQLGEMFLKWALFGFGDKSAGGGGGLFGALFSGLSSLFGGGGNLIPDSVGVTPGDIGIIFPGLAGGGAVSAGSPVMVGENGPELFMPSTAGAIIPGGGGAGPQVTVVYNIDARGSSITEAQFVRSLAESENRAVQRALLTTREVQLRTA